jgi:hypothetical protein
MKPTNALSTLVAVSALALAPAAFADPCGMVPPIWEGQGPALTRVGDQLTYVFYKDGVESFVIRPGFKGKVDEFGMLIPFPTPPAIRKVDDPIFGHIAAAVDPPEVVVDLRPQERMARSRAFLSDAAPAGLSFKKGAPEAVRVIKEEAVGMYEVAVLEAGSAAALTRWLDDHGYQYPEGMGPVAQDYVSLGWCFVAVKTKVGTKKGVTPRPGMTNANSKLPTGASFDGNVQAMGFRFKSDELVVPMRLSAFNGGDLHNIVYLLTDRPVRADGLSEDLVVRQVSGEKLYRHVTGLLPLRVIGGTESDIPAQRLKSLVIQRNPTPKNGLAKNLFASDLMAIRLGRLALPHEEQEKVLLRIGERLGLRGEEIDTLHRQALAASRDEGVLAALEDLKGMTLTVVDGNFDREVIARDNLTFTGYDMPISQNEPTSYDAKTRAPTPTPEGVTYGSTAKETGAPTVASRPKGMWGAVALVLLVAFGCVGLGRRTSAA